MKIINGTGVSEGISIAKVFKLEEIDLSFEKKTIKAEDVDKEINFLNQSIKTASDQIVKLKNNAVEKIGEEEAQIFDAHNLILNDPEFLKMIESKIKNNLIDAISAFDKVSLEQIKMFESMDNEYFKGRAADIKDVSDRVKTIMLGKTGNDLSLINTQTIIIADDLTPSETSQINKEFIKGFVTRIGSKTSHSAILARTIEVPAVLGVSQIDEIKENDEIIIDGSEGKIIINPDKETKNDYLEKIKEIENEKKLLESLINEPAVSKDGKEIKLMSNIGSVNDLDDVIKNKAQGIGLFRSEFLYMDSKEMPSEDFQYEKYKEVISKMDGKEVIIRTLDIGGDKNLDYLKFNEEMNPFLGYRAIRIGLDQKQILIDQVRAILRASAFGKVSIMFPMIATVDEFLSAKKIVQEQIKKLKSENIKIDENINLGIMIEIPASAVIADQFAKHVDFFSIGSNDLIQYTMATDRMNEKVSYLYQTLNPAILKLIQMTVKAAHNNDIWVGVCGEMGSDQNAAPLLFGLGIDELSMTSSSLLKIKKIIRENSYSQLQQIAQKATTLDTEKEVIQLLKDNNIIK